MSDLVLSALFLAALLWREWSHTKERERLLKVQEGLLNRIQAPAQVITELSQPDELKQYVGIEDDEAFHEAKRELNGN